MAINKMPKNINPYQNTLSYISPGYLSPASQTHQSFYLDVSINQQAPTYFLPKFLLAQKSRAANKVIIMHRFYQLTNGGKMNSVINRIVLIIRIQKRNLLFGMKVELRDKWLDLVGQRIELSIFITIFYTEDNKDLILIIVNKTCPQTLQFGKFVVLNQSGKMMANLQELINFIYSFNTYQEITNINQDLTLVLIMSQSLPASSQKIVRFSMKKLGIKQGKSFLINDLPKRVLKLLSDDKAIVSIKLLQSPLHFIHNLKQELLLFVKENYDYLTGAKDGQIAFNQLNVTRGCLLGLSIAAKYIDNQYLPININHHEILIQFQGGLFLILGFCDDGLEYISGIDDEQLIDRRPGNKIIKSYSGNYRGKKLEQFLTSNQEKAYNLLFWNCQYFARELINYVVGVNQEANV